VIDKKLRATSKQVRQRSAPFVGLETILFLDPNPWQFLPLPCQFVAPPCVLLLRFEQLEPRCEPVLLRCDLAVLDPVWGFDFQHNVPFFYRHEAFDSRFLHFRLRYYDEWNGRFRTSSLQAGAAVSFRTTNKPPSCFHRLVRENDDAIPSGPRRNEVHVCLLALAEEQFAAPH